MTNQPCMFGVEGNVAFAGVSKRSLGRATSISIGYVGSLCCTILHSMDFK